MIQLAEGYEIRKMSVEEFRPMFRENRPKLFGDNLTFHFQEALSDHEKAAQQTLASRMGAPYELYLGLYHQGELRGWSFGRQVDSEKFYMVNSAVFPEHRRKGLYRALMKTMLDEATLEGFQVIFSRHVATNSAILIPKLKAGFVISAFELSDIFGLMVQLSFFTNPVRRKMMEFRSGQTVPDEELRRYLRL